MTIKITDLNELTNDVAQSDVLPIVDIGAQETKKIQVANLLRYGISGMPSGSIDLSRLDQDSATKLSYTALATNGVASGTYGNASTVPQFTVNSQGLVTFASGIAIAVTTNEVSGLAPVATSGTYASLSGLPSLGTIASQDAGNVAISGGTISGVSFVSGDVVISGGTISGIVDLAIADGGTGASTASGARTNLGLAIGTDVQAYDYILTDLTSAYDTADTVVYASSSGVVAATSLSSYGRSLISGTTASAVRSTLGLGNIALQDAGNVAISGGTISGVSFVSGSAIISGGTITDITDLAIADGGTGASTASSARTNLGLAIGTDVQAYNSVLASLTTAYNTANTIPYASASGVVSTVAFSAYGRSLVSGSTASIARTTLELGTIATQNASAVSISGGTIAGIADLAVADGGTGASTASDARTNLGLAIGTDVQAYDATLAGIAGLSPGSGTFIYANGTDSFQAATIGDYARTMLASGTSAANTRAYLGLGALATVDYIGNANIYAASISGDALASGTITSREVGADAVYTAALQDSCVTAVKIVDSGVTADKLADNSSAIVSTGAPVSPGNFVGQQYFDTATSFEYIWDGDSWERQAAINTIDFVDSTPLAFAVSYPDDYSATITTTLDNQSVNTIFAGPASGASTAPTFRNLTAADLPVATSVAVGAVAPGAGLSVDAGGTLNHSNTFAAGQYIGALTIDAQGHITNAATTLVASDIPSLDASIITTGTFGSERLATNSVTAEQLADNGIAQVSETAPNPQFAGQWWVNPSDRSTYIWVGQVGETLETSNGYWLNLGYGNLQNENLRFAGTYNASGNTIATVTQYSTQAGLGIGDTLNAPSESNNGLYYIVTTSGYGSGAAPVGVLAAGDWVVSLGQGANWETLDFASAVAGVSDGDVLVDGPSLVPAASGISTQEGFNTDVWGRVQVATASVYGVVRASSEIAVASGTGIMSIGIVDDGSY